MGEAGDAQGGSEPEPAAAKPPLMTWPWSVPRIWSSPACRQSAPFLASLYLEANGPEKPRTEPPVLWPWPR